VPPAIDPCPAATVVLLRDDPAGLEVLLVRRREALAFMGGAHVFPGGRVDNADRAADPVWCRGIEQAERRMSPLAPRDGVSFYVAAARELFEEAGVLLAVDCQGRPLTLAREGDAARFLAYRAEVLADARRFRAVLEAETLALDLERLVFCAHWITPPRFERRFDTRFFLAPMIDGQTADHDRGETTDSLWIRPADALARDQEGLLQLPPPTRHMLGELTAFGSVASALASYGARVVERREPR